MPDPTYTFEGLRGVGRVELSFVPEQRVYALFGTNGVGKTKCLEGLFQYQFFQNNKSLRSFFVKLGFSQEDLVAQTVFGPENGRLGEILGLPNISRTLEIADADSSSFTLPCVFLGAGERGHILLDTVQLGVPVGTFEQRRQRHFELLVDGMRKHFSSLGMHANVEQWFVTLAQSANPYQTSNDNRRVEIDTLLRLLNKIDGRFSPDFMQVDGANRVSLKIDGVVTQLLHLSTGFTSLVKLLQPIISGYANFTNEPDITQVKGLVFIDEIENHLHVKWQSTIIVLLKELFPKTTFFVATHSPIVLSQLHAGEAYLLTREGDLVSSHLIDAPNKRVLADVLADAMGVNLNALKKAQLDEDDQSSLKRELQGLLDAAGSGA